MNGPTITMMPTMRNPENLSHQELIEQYKYMEEAMFKQGQTLHDVNCKLAKMNQLCHQLHSQLLALVDAHDENDQEAIAVQLKAMSDQRKSFMIAKVH